MLHVSTRGQAPAVSFTDALLAGLARDGGLYVPEAWPTLDRDAISGLAGLPYAEVATRIVGLLSGGAQDASGPALADVVHEAYAAFRHPAVCPLTQLGPNLFVLELFHGPTLAFKDVAMRLLAGLMNRALDARGERATIVGATSGDTGSAAIDAFRGRSQVDVVILYPHGRVSEVQRRQMTTPAEDNVHAVAIEGTFDDCQALVKAMFNHHAFRDELALSGVNSINWARIAAQVVYYVTAAVALGSPGRPVSFAVPTGNFGNVLAGYVAKRMGLPIKRLVVGTNENDILARALGGEGYQTAQVVHTTSPSMDIQVSSNFERVLFDALERDPVRVRSAMGTLAQSGSMMLPDDVLGRLRRDFDAGTARQAEVDAVLRETWRQAEYLADPHTAIGLHVAGDALARDPATPMVVLGTAHPAKFPDAVQAATGVRPALPPHLAHLMQARERLTVLPNDQHAVESFIRARSRARRGGARKGEAA